MAASFLMKFGKGSRSRAAMNEGQRSQGNEGLQTRPPTSPTALSPRSAPHSPRPTQPSSRSPHKPRLSSPPLRHRSVPGSPVVLARKVTSSDGKTSSTVEKVIISPPDHGPYVGNGSAEYGRDDVSFSSNIEEDGMGHEIPFADDGDESDITSTVSVNMQDGMSRSSSVTSTVLMSPSDQASASDWRLDRQKMTVGEIVQEIETRSSNLLLYENFTTPETLNDLGFLVMQSRYNSDMSVKKKLVTKMVENGLLDIFIKVFKSVHTVDFLGPLRSEDNGDYAEIGARGGLEPPSRDIDPAGSRDGSSLSLAEDARDRKGKFRVEKPRNVPDSTKNLMAAISLLQHVTERSPSLCEDCLRRGVVRLILLDLNDSRLGTSELRDQSRVQIVKGYLTIMSSILRFHVEWREHFRELGAVKTLQQYLRSSLLQVKARSLLLLVSLVNESENDIIHASDRHISFAIKMLQTTLEAHNHFARRYGFWAVEVLAGLNRMACCESNKFRMVLKGLLPWYTRLLCSAGSEEEQLVASQGLWSLAFDPQARYAIRDQQSLLQALDNLSRSSQREEIRQTTRNALWVILEKHSALRPSPTPGPSRELQPHILISYQWSCRHAMLRVRDRLKSAGYRVWMDTENKGGTPVDGLVSCMERAAIVLIAMSQRYKDSPHCRTEAEYACHLDKDMIPLRLQPRYSPDGWLADVVGPRLCFDLSSDDNLHTMLPNLIHELGARGRISQPESGSSGQVCVQVHQVAAGSSNAVTSHQVARWSVQDVGKWLQDSQLDSLQDRLSQMDGELLLELRRMQRAAPESFYSTLKTDLSLDLIAVLRLTKALDQLCSAFERANNDKQKREGGC